MVLIRVYEFILIMNSGKSGWGDRNIPYTVRKSGHKCRRQLSGVVWHLVGTPEAGRPGVQHHPLLCSEFETSLDYVRCCLKYKYM